MSTEFDVIVTYETGNYLFEDQIKIVGDAGPFSDRGDSGALIMSRHDNAAVGLLFGGSAEFTIANHLVEVLHLLGVTLA